MERFVLTDAQWAKMEPHCLGKPSDPGRSGSDNRRFVEAVLWIVRTSSPWRDLPPSLGHWNSVFTRFRDWVKAEFKRLFDAVSDDPDMEYAMGRRHHRQDPPPWTGRKRGTSRQAIGRSKAGMTTKILALTDALGNLVRFELLPGHRFDTVGRAATHRRCRLWRLDRRQGLRRKRHHRRSRCARRQSRHLPASAPRHTARHRHGDVQMASPDRELLLQAQRLQTHRSASRQNRSQLRSYDPSSRRRDKLPMNPNRP